MFISFPFPLPNLPLPLPLPFAFPPLRPLPHLPFMAAMAFLCEASASAMAAGRCVCPQATVSLDLGRSRPITHLDLLATQGHLGRSIVHNPHDHVSLRNSRDPLELVDFGRLLVHEFNDGLHIIEINHHSLGAIEHISSYVGVEFGK